ncbi:MAG: non-heme chloroperoxidase [Ferruginibacter sp.]|uniref:alpha/beta fold hydrolase n=1 Tax=Ferruginibacter sp. TaxID=1940288 RepID=UPI00265A1A58|nr:alpha/beta hydrolase [Ferruginibacter sp.]MDB5280439.1 non-heme chloroperoxidase [Ferruginibacter sp.]
MPFITSNQNNAEPVNIYYEDCGKGKPAVFIHGWPLNGAMWEYQVTQLTQQGIRCITYDRRGFGKSDWPYDGYDYNTMAGDLKALLDELNLEDVTLVGFSMGGGEIAKYFSLYGGARVTKVMLVSAVVPYMLHTSDNPEGVPQEQFDTMANGIKQDRPAFMESFGKDFFGVSLLNHPVSDAFLANNLTQVMKSSPIATLQCAHSFSSTDFRQDVTKINVPTLIIHGDSDKTVPIKATGEESAKLIPNATFIVYEGEPHGLWYTAKERLNEDLRDFILISADQAGSKFREREIVRENSEPYHAF